MSEKAGKLGGREFAQGLSTQIDFGEGADADASQALNAQANDFEHAADVAVAAFAEYNAQGGGAAGPRGFGNDGEGTQEFTIVLDAGEHGSDLVAGGEVVSPGAIFFFDVVAGMRQSLGEIAVVGEQNESFAVVVEASDGVEAQLMHAIDQGKPAPHWQLSSPGGRRYYKEGAEAQLIALGDLYGVNLRKPPRAVPISVAEGMLDPAVLEQFYEKRPYKRKLVPFDSKALRKLGME